MNSAMTANIYNHFLTAYAPKSITRYDTHKKSELRSIYNSIVKLNKDSPWYLETKGRATQEYAISIKENARLLHNSIASLGGLDAGQTLAKKAAYSSDSDIASVSYVGSGREETPSPSFTLTVNSLAVSQENMGAFLPDEPVSLPADTYSFDVTINDLNYEFQFNINQGDTNKDIQERLIRLVNNADIGIHARLDEGNARSSIRLTSAATGVPDGKSEIFKISDTHTSKQSGTVDYFGLSFISRPPANSSLLINGEPRSTVSNTFTVGKVFEVEIKGVSEPDTSVSIGLKTDVESLTDNVNSLIGSYNTFISNTSVYRQNQSLSSKLIKEMNTIALHYQEEMKNMGISLQSDSTIAIDEDILQESASSSDGSFSFNTLKNFAGALMQKTTQVALDPMHYVNRTMVAYKNPRHNFATPYITSAYSGMMFSSYC
mgnify:CR=1 FL=1